MMHRDPVPEDLTNAAVWPWHRATLKSTGPAPGGFPWGNNRPTLRQRVLVTFGIAIMSAVLHYFRAAEWNGKSDFAPLWQAARVALSGGNPYELIGPGLSIESAYPMYYPATAFVAALPFSVIPSFHLASTTFVFVSALLLAWGVTADGWHRLPMFVSISYCTTAFLGQWSIIMTAAIFIPAISMIAFAKPPSAIPVIGSSTSLRSYQAALLGGAVMVAVSLYLVPTWPKDWWLITRTSSDFVAPVFRFAGPAILLVALRWRRPEAWLILIAACMPQTWPPYNSLVLMAVAMTYHEACFLSLVSSISWATFAWFWGHGLTPEEAQTQMSTVLNLSGYLPAMIVVLRRPNIGNGPLWLEWSLGIARRKFGPQ